MNFVIARAIFTASRYLAALVLLQAVGAASALAGQDLQAIYEELDRRFTFVEQLHGDRPRLAARDAPFEGDCDDFAYAAYARLLAAGLQPEIWIVKPRYTRRLHMLTCAAGRCFDTERRGTVSMLRLRLKHDYSHWRRARASETWVRQQLAITESMDDGGQLQLTATGH